MPVDVKMPQLGESVTEGTIGRWLKQPGDPVAKYEPLLEVTTDKVDTEISSVVDGALLEILVPEGETVRVGALIARLVEQDEQKAAPPAAPPSTVAERRGAPEHPAASPPISPVVARLAAEHGIDLHLIRGSGANGRVTKKDVEQYLAGRREPVDTSGAQAPSDVVTSPAPPVSPTPDATGALQETMESRPRSSGEATAQSDEQDMPRVETGPEPAIRGLEPGDQLVPLTAMRRSIAEHMTRSVRTAPQVTTVMEVDLTRVVAHRERMKGEYERQGARLTYTPYFVQAAVAALRDVPLVNASYGDDGILMHSRINIGVAVAIADGLLVPVIKDADEKSLLGLARVVNDLGARARSRRLQPDETRGGTFTITNHGTSGSLFATPIINQPEAAILGVGAIEKRAVVVSEGATDAIAIRPRAYLSLTIDHRILDGATADQFLQALKTTLEQYTG